MDLKESALMLEAARNGRNLGDIPHNDPYWAALRDHQQIYANSLEPSKTSGDLQAYYDSLLEEIWT